MYNSHYVEVVGALNTMCLWGMLFKIEGMSPPKTYNTKRQQEYYGVKLS